MVGAIVLIDKKQGDTSAQTVAAVRRLFGGVKAGHTGTLDPMATGLLPVTLGEAGGFIRFMRDDKSYRATVRFGVESDTGDAWGTLSAPQKTPTELAARVRDRLPDFIGDIMQTAPRHSALKYKGKPLYYYARNSIPVPDKRRRVRVHDIRLEKSEGVKITLFIRSGGGFYVRALARDLGADIGCGAHLAALRRLHCASFDIVQAQSVDVLSVIPAAMRQLLPVEAALAHLPAQAISNVRLRALAQGCCECLADAGTYEKEQLVRLQNAEGKFAGIALQRGAYFLTSKLLSWTRKKENYDN